MKSSINIQNVYNSYTACFCIECIKASTAKQIPSKLFSSWCWIDGCSSYVFCESNLSQRLYPEVREGTAKPRVKRRTTGVEVKGSGIMMKQESQKDSWF